MSNFRVHYAGACFENGDFAEQVEKRVHDRLISLGKVLDVVASPSHADWRNLGTENYVVSFEGEITVQAETDVEAENQGHDRLGHLGQIMVVAFKQ